MQSSIWRLVALLRSVSIRNREGVSPSLRKAEHIPPSELCAAIWHIVESHIGVSIDDAIRESARLLGFKSAGSQLREVFSNAVETLISQGKLEERESKLYEVKRDIENLSSTNQ